MTKEMQLLTPVPKGPAYIVWFVPESKGEPRRCIGSLWPTKNGKGFRMSLSLDLVPRNEGSTLIMMPYRPRKAGGGEGA